MAERFSQTEAVSSLRTWWYNIEEVFEIIHPDFGQAPVVLVDDLARSSREAVWGGLPENMAHMGTCYNFQRATTLPDLQTHKDKLNLYIYIYICSKKAEKYTQYTLNKTHDSSLHWLFNRWRRNWLTVINKDILLFIFRAVRHPGGARRQETVIFPVDGLLYWKSVSDWMLLWSWITAKPHFLYQHRHR